MVWYIGFLAIAGGVGLLLAIYTMTAAQNHAERAKHDPLDPKCKLYNGDRAALYLHRTCKECNPNAEDQRTENSQGTGATGLG